MIGRGGGIWALNEHMNLHFRSEQDIYMNVNKYEANDYGTIWTCLPCYINCVLFSSLRKAGAERKVSI